MQITACMVFKDLDKREDSRHLMVIRLEETHAVCQPAYQSGGAWTTHEGVRLRTRIRLDRLGNPKLFKLVFNPDFFIGV